MILVAIVIVLAGICVCVPLAVQAFQPEPHNCHGCARCRGLHVGGQS